MKLPVHEKSTASLTHQALLLIPLDKLTKMALASRFRKEMSESRLSKARAILTTLTVFKT